MFLANRVREFLDARRVIYEVQIHGPAQSLEQVSHATGIPAWDIVCAVVVRRQSGGLVMLVLPLNHRVDFDSVSELLGAEVELVTPETLDAIFYDCALGAIPPLGQAYGVEVIVDECFLEREQLFFEPGERSSLIRISGKDFSKVHQDVRWARISSLQQTVSVGANRSSDLSGEAMASVNAEIASLTLGLEARRKVEHIYELPPMPEMAGKILRLKNNPDATIAELSQFVELDPSLAAQVVRYAGSSFFGYGGKITTIKDAIARVLGYDLVMNIALGICATKAFRLPTDGPLGLKSYWRHATYAAALCQQLAKALPKSARVNPGMAYLAGLLHNFGFLLLGHLYEREFFLLNKVVASHPEIPIAAIERQVLVTGQSKGAAIPGHTSMGACLMEAWDMPEEIIVAVREHHDDQYQGSQQMYAKLVFVANVLLKSKGIGDSATAEMPAGLLEQMGLDASKVSYVMQEILIAAEQLDAMAIQLAA